jgi:hypothetical protein
MLSHLSSHAQNLTNTYPSHTRTNISIPQRYKLYYVTSAIQWEMALVFLLPITDLCRNYITTRGNKTEQVGQLIWSMCLAAPTILGYVYFLHMQTYVLHIDKWLNGTALAFVSFEVVLSLFALMVFRSAYGTRLLWWCPFSSRN